ncbi:hypothetical protein [Candidatus Oleimmundimicrobium sp.]|uniref:hypothetical protein n=1 Tax=Candidatus Oleimmundimicrobium sp. TaxID=3060597 RepID=UPI002718B0CA|nr:hypothetical protein [Candidatus Oleimmundimicrobium sp.]MDO8885396.1 hypothetical protein [Candidatus Oleimmundimicrobium sp.]
MKSFGRADEFYRVKLITLSETQPEEFDWKEDVLYRNPPKEFTVSNEIEYLVMIVDKNTGESHHSYFYKFKPKAQKKFELIKKDLKELTKMQFQKRYHI